MASLAVNKRALHDYEILKKFEAGIKLTGAEVKSVKLGKVDLTGSYVRISPTGEALLSNATISSYPPARDTQMHYDPRRNRTLLLHRKEIASLTGTTKVRGITLVPLSLYTRQGIIKLEMGLGRGKSKYDKRETIKKKEMKQRIRTHLLHNLLHNA
ncbi:MAG: SsrA-binding protein SmpB [Patescibacteria group bacterium]